MNRNLDTLLARYPSTARPTGPVQALGNAGGLSGATLWRYPSGLGRLVARAWPADGPDLAAVETIHGWLGRAHHLPFVAVPIAALDGRTATPLDGRTWEVAPWLDGGPVAEPKAGVLRGGFEALARFHLALESLGVEGRSPGLARRLDELDRLATSSGGRLDHALGAAQGPLADQARGWLEQARRLAPTVADLVRPAAGITTRLQPVLRDARPDHLLFQADRLTGLVDYGAMGLDPVAADLSRLLAGWLGEDRSPRAEAIAAYHAIRPLGPADDALIAALERSSALLGGGRWAIWHFVEGRRFQDPSAVSRGLTAGLERLAALATEIGGT